MPTSRLILHWNQDLPPGSPCIGQDWRLTPRAILKSLTDGPTHHITSSAREDVKAGPFEPEYGGAANFYLDAVDDILTHWGAQTSPSVES